MKKCMSSMSRRDTVQLWNPRIAALSGTPYFASTHGLRVSRSSSTSSNMRPHSGCVTCSDLLAEALVLLGDLHLVLVEALDPEVVRALRHRVADDADLAGAGRALRPVRRQGNVVVRLPGEPISSPK